MQQRSSKLPAASATAVGMEAKPKICADATMDMKSHVTFPKNVMTEG